MPKIYPYTLIIAFATILSASAEIKITVQAGSRDRHDCIVKDDASGRRLLASSSVELYEITGGQHIAAKLNRRLYRRSFPKRFKNSNEADTLIAHPHRSPRNK